jgi:A/G-specific adenine glycosylase
VGAFAFGRDGVALDTNVRRLFSRLGFSLAPAPGTGPVFNQATIELGALVCTAREARCGVCPVASWCGSRGSVAAPVRRSDAQVRFEDTDRWARGRVVAALAAGAELPEMAPERLERALAGLARDGLVVLDGGVPRLPAG